MNFLFHLFIGHMNYLLSQDFYSPKIFVSLNWKSSRWLMVMITVVRATSLVWGLTVWQVLYIYYRISPRNNKPTCMIIPILKMRKGQEKLSNSLKAHSQWAEQVSRPDLTNLSPFCLAGRLWGAGVRGSSSLAGNWPISYQLDHALVSCHRQCKCLP